MRVDEGVCELLNGLWRWDICSWNFFEGYLGGGEEMRKCVGHDN